MTHEELTNDETLRRHANWPMEPKPEPVWPYTTVYFMPDGMVKVEDHANDQPSHHSLYFSQAFMVIRVKHPARKCDLPEVRATKFRGELGKFMESFVASFLDRPGAEEELARKILAPDPEIDE